MEPTNVRTVTRRYVPAPAIPGHLADGWTIVYYLDGGDDHPVVRPVGAVMERRA